MKIKPNKTVEKFLNFVFLYKRVNFLTLLSYICIIDSLNKRI